MSVQPIPSEPHARARQCVDELTGRTDQSEQVLSNGRSGEAKISICVPTWKDSADALLASLIRLPGAEACTLLIFDDGSADSDLTRQLARQILRYPGPARLITAPRNMGRSHARNRLQALAESEWILFLDADMYPDDADFLNRYLDAVDASEDPALIPGGFSLRHATPTAMTRLHAAQSQASECVPACLRAQDPGRYVFTSNILVHRKVLSEIRFDPGFKGWGWEDVDWGLRVAGAYPVHHIDNPATHLGLDEDKVLIHKYARSGENFARLLARHEQAMRATPLYRAAHRFARLPGRSALERFTYRLTLTRWLPIRFRLVSLKLYRALIYGAHL
ncbi:MAG: glycosyltransferase family A protein [Pseudomonadota bacterium]